MKTLLKQNALIRAEAVEKVVPAGTIKEEKLIYKEYTAKEHDVLNALLYILQTRLFATDSLTSLMEEEQKGNLWFTFQLSEIKSLAKIKDNSGGAVKNIIDSIISKTFRLKQVLTTNDDGKLIKKEIISALVKEAEFIAYGKENYVRLQFSRVFVALAHTDYSLRYGNYTKLKKLDLDQITEITNKTAKRLYEYINMRNGRFVKLTEEDLRTICGEQPSFSNYKIKIKDAIAKLDPLVKIEIETWKSRGESKYCELDIDR
jgi:hypothetical protein